MSLPPHPFDIAPEPPAPEREALLAALGQDPPAAADAREPWWEAGVREATGGDPAP